MLSFSFPQWNIESAIADTPQVRRFMPFNERSIEALSGPYLWFSHIENFNDPFEAQFEYIFLRDPQRIIDAVYYSGMSGWPFDIANEKLWEEYQKDNEAFYLKWQTEFRNIYEQAASDAKFAYCCFFSDRRASRSEKEVALMWSHYGNGLRGMRVTYDTEKLIRSLSKDVRATFMAYSASPRRIDLIEEFVGITGPKGPRWSADLFYESPSTKSDIWEYESEFRIVSELPGAIDFDPAAIQRVDLGDKMPDSQKRVISLLVNQVNPNARIFIAKVRTGSFEMDYIPQ
ncbi:hypothetical protein DN820_01700 [Stutzerimonas nosocomialis]|uniref:DUF2971 domain-containing protein n=1 Tax=Stutzerimonas nosocomialis TaxID=1056496 RepID=A0A5R9QIE0_9GAMM|nr:DUF2971 domain-containing protein [Stutzerimonas nosocomialis]TLX65054.1 hypothetical protein DN820_01700 [Stutzerimonas nosocomialis]